MCPKPVQSIREKEFLAVIQLRSGGTDGKREGEQPGQEREEAAVRDLLVLGLTAAVVALHQMAVFARGKLAPIYD
jgi:hypothetical protein